MSHIGDYTVSWCYYYIHNDIHSVSQLHVPSSWFGHLQVKNILLASELKLNSYFILLPSRVTSKMTVRLAGSQRESCLQIDFL